MSRLTRPIVTKTDARPIGSKSWANIRASDHNAASLLKSTSFDGENAPVWLRIPQPEQPEFGVSITNAAANG
ncbi:hypothetical protein CGZ80_08770 [Rhodopirellula sp. MGV]|nr:hypothetical protein CGZ80_08770 [Rhodopirellula sp. MGV]PNY36818.1 hypothetical protein C2E31_10675 [Rhodopirellula baltica]